MKTKQETFLLVAFFAIVIAAIPAVNATQDYQLPASGEEIQLDTTPVMFPINIDAVELKPFEHAGYYRAHSLVRELVIADLSLGGEELAEKAFKSIEVYIDEYPNHENLINAFIGVAPNGQTSAGKIVAAVQEYNRTLDAISAAEGGNTLMAKASKDPYFLAIELYLKSIMEQVNTQIARQNAPLPPTVEEPQPHSNIVDPQEAEPVIHRTVPPSWKPPMCAADDFPNC